jgi:hypothetical protein
MKRTLLPQFLFATSVLCIAGLPAFGQEDAKPQHDQRNIQAHGNGGAKRDGADH